MTNLDELIIALRRVPEGDVYRRSERSGWAVSGQAEVIIQGLVAIAKPESSLVVNRLMAELQSYANLSTYELPFHYDDWWTYQDAYDILPAIAPFALALAAIGSDGLQGAIDLAYEGRSLFATSVGEVAIKAFCYNNGDAVPAIIKQLRMRHSMRIIKCLLLSLEMMGAKAVGAVPFLAEALLIYTDHSSDDESMSISIISALRGIGPSAAGAATALISTLARPSKRIRNASLCALLGLPREEMLPSRVLDVLVPRLIDSLEDIDCDLQYNSFLLLRHIGPDAVPSISPFLTDKPTEATGLKCRHAYERALANTGLARFGDTEVYMMIEQLRVFRDIGLYCRSRNTDVFSFTSVANELVIGEATVRRYVASVSNFFRTYFKRFEGIIVADDDDCMATTREKLFDRGQGKRGTTIGPLGWRAWEETCRYLEARDFHKVDNLTPSAIIVKEGM